MTYINNKQSQENTEELKTVPIAIIGMASIFPKAKNLPEYWDNILHKIDCVSDVPSSRWKIDDYYDPDPNAEDKTYCKRGGFIPDIDFDPAEFGLPPNILEVTDVSQLLGLVVARDALEDAGYGEGREFNREFTGVVLGVVGMSSKLFTPLMARLQYPIWEKALQSSGLSTEDTQKIITKIKAAYVGWEENAFPGTIGNVIAGRIANRFDLGGMNCVVDAACASSLAAFRMAVAELIEGRAEMMITGGVDTDNSINTFLCFSKTPAFSKGDHVRTFDAESDGMMVGEGIGMLVLKRLADAERDGDRIYAVVKGVGTSSDGRFKSIYAPRPAGQAKALRRAYQEAGFSPHTVGLIEAHGTGTMAGDPAEFQGIKEVFSDQNPNQQTIALGSVKSQIAHTKATAGAASLIKTALALYHKVLPATINVTRPNPKFGIENSPFYINTETRPWFRARPDIPRRAGVNSFGFGGTNFHVVLEEHEVEHQKAYRVSSVPDAFLISAAAPEKISAICRDMLDKLSSENAAQAYSEWATQSQTLNIPQSDARLGLLAASIDEAVHLLQTSLTMLETKRAEKSWEHPEGLWYRQSGLDPQGGVVALFPGQGSQYVDMGRELAVHFPPIRAEFSQMDSLFANDGLEPLSMTVYPRPAFSAEEKEKHNERLTRTENAQPAIGVLSAGMYKLFRTAGFTPDFIAGHSYGELTALWAAGVLNDPDYLALTKARGKAMSPLADPNFDAGTMLAVKGDADQISAEVKHYPGITLANWNSRHQVVLAGARGDIASAEKALKEKGYSVVQLPVSAAFHTHLVGHAHKPFALAIQAAAFNPSKSRLFSNTTGDEYPHEPEEIRRILTDHMRNPVLFKDEIEAIYAQGGRIFVEFGPKSVLTSLVDDILEGKPHAALAVNPNAKKDSDRQLREAALRLRVLGLPMTEIDPFRAVPKTLALRKKSSIAITLNGGLYVSEKTRQAYADSLEDGFKVTQSLPGIDRKEEEPKKADTPVAESNPELASILEQAVRSFHENQNEGLRLHESFLKGESDYSRIFSEITQMEGALVKNSLNSSGQTGALAAILENMERSMMRYHDHQNETLRVHETYLKTQAETSQRYLDVLGQMMGNERLPAPGAAVLPAAPTERRQAMPATPVVQKKNVTEPVIQIPEVPAPRKESLLPSPIIEENDRSNGKGAKPARVDVDAISTALLEVVSEKTGYPVEMLEPGMDMEADLGIDSIKRVEILGAMQTRFPELPKVQPEVLAELRTLGQIRDQLSAKAEPSMAADSTAQPITIASPAAGLVGREEIKKNAAGIEQEVDAGEIAKIMLKVVSEKTGYPPEMLELDMDMEADLGIDSIKRVEILGAVQQSFPELPTVKAEDLAEMHSLRQIIDYLGTGSLEQHVETPIQSEDKVEALFGSVKMGMVSRKSLPLPDHIDFSLADGMIGLVTDDGTATTLEVVRRLQSNGMKVVVLSFPQEIIPLQNDFPVEIDRVVLDNLSEEHLRQTLADIAKVYGSVAVFIHLDPIPGKFNKAEQDDLISEKEILKTIFMLAKHLKEPLNKAALNGRAVFMTVVHLDGEFGLGRQIPFEPVSGGLFGLVKTLNLEWEGVFCRALDLSPNISAQETATIIQSETHDPNRLVIEVGYGPQGRLTLVVETINHEEVRQ